MHLRCCIAFGSQRNVKRIRIVFVALASDCKILPSQTSICLSGNCNSLSTAESHGYKMKGHSVQVPMYFLSAVRQKTRRGPSGKGFWRQTRDSLFLSRGLAAAAAAAAASPSKGPSRIAGKEGALLHKPPTSDVFVQAAFLLRSFQNTGDLLRRIFISPKNCSLYRLGSLKCAQLNVFSPRMAGNSLHASIFFLFCIHTQALRRRRPSPQKPHSGSFFIRGKGGGRRDRHFQEEKASDRWDFHWRAGAAGEGAKKLRRGSAWLAVEMLLTKPSWGEI